MIKFKVNVTAKTNLKVKCPVCGRTPEIKMEQMVPGMDLDVPCECGNTVKLKADALNKFRKRAGFLERIFGKKNQEPDLPGRG